MDILAMFKDSDKTQNYSEGAFIFHQGEPGASMYVILEGEVDILLNDIVIATFKPGDTMGEMALIDEEPRSASAFAKTDCKLVPIDKENFLYLVQQTPYFALHVMKTLSGKVRAVNKMISVKSE